MSTLRRNHHTPSPAAPVKPGEAPKCQVAAPVPGLFSGERAIPDLERDRCLLVLEHLQKSASGLAVSRLATTTRLSPNLITHAVEALVARNLVHRRACDDDMVVWLDQHPWPEALLPSAKELRTALLSAIPTSATCREDAVLATVGKRFAHLTVPGHVLATMVRRMLRAMAAEGAFVCQNIAILDGGTLCQMPIWHRTKD